MNEFINRSMSLKNLSPLYRKLHSFGLNKGFSMEEHRHSFYHINLILKGSVTFVSPERTISVSKGNVIIVPPFLSHSLYTDTGYLQIGMDMNPYEDPSGFYRMFKAATPEGLQKVPILNYYKYQPVDCFYVDLSEYNRLKAIHFMDSILLEVISAYKESSRNTFKDRFLDLMSQPRSDHLCVTEIASQLNISKVHLERLTRREFGCSVKQYMDKIRLLVLCQYLEQTSLSQQEICYEMGFCDESHLTHFFKHHMECTPREYRRNVNTF